MLARLKAALLAIHRDERGAMSVEKVLILAVIALPILIALYAFRKVILGWFSDQQSQISPI